MPLPSAVAWPIGLPPPSVRITVAPASAVPAITLPLLGSITGAAGATESTVVLAGPLVLPAASWRLLAASQRLEELLRRHGWPPAGGSALFQRLVDPRCAALHDYLARRGILTRQFEQPASLRLGLPADEAAWPTTNWLKANCSTD